ncbi:MAG: tetratricopeptide repeat protein, partial [Armatimonadia bacterium]|nr:tetratricopeptide repeat protein [Armatimonadia bacterium]
VITHHGYADAGARRGKLERDRRILDAEIGEKPDDPFNLFNMGCIEQELGQREEAIEHLRRSIDLSEPHASQVRKCYAMILQMQRELGQLDAAQTTEREARKHYSEDPEVLFQAGLLHRDLGNLREAEDRFLKAIDAPSGGYFASVDPAIQGYKARYNLGTVYMDMGQPQRAVEQWRVALAERPGFEPGQRMLTYALLQSGQLAEAEPELRRLLKLSPDDAEAHHNLATLLCELERYGESIPVAEQCLSLRPDRTDTYFALAEAQDKLGDRDAAIETIERLLRRDPSSQRARQVLDEWKAGV